MRGVWSGASMPSQRVIAWACGPLSASARGTPSAICSAANESSMVSRRGAAGVGQPVRPAVADPAHDEDAAVDDGGHERARGRVARPAGGVGDDGVVGRVGRGDERLRARRDPGGDGARCPSGRAARQHVARGPGRGQAGDVGVGRRGDPVADDQHGVAARLGLGGERDGVLVAGVADAAVADGGHPGGGLLGEVVARARCPGAALRAVAVVGDVAAALGRHGRGVACGAPGLGAVGGARSAPRVGSAAQVGAAGLAEPLAGGDRARHDGQSSTARHRRARRPRRPPGPSRWRHRNVQRRTALAWSTRRTRSSRLAACPARSR